MSLKRMLLPAAMIVLMALLTPCANAQTMGEYATTTAGVGTGAGSMGTSFSLPSGSLGGGSSGTWGASRLGSSFEERAAAMSGSGGLGQSFESRAASAAGRCFCSEGRWPGTGFAGSGTQSRFATSDRFSTGDRFTATDRFSSGNRWPGSAFQDHMGLDTHFNSVNGN